jgi:pimeloyl-ACP methyl ester carboxylesterase
MLSPSRNTQSKKHDCRCEYLSTDYGPSYSRAVLLIEGILMNKSSFADVGLAPACLYETFETCSRKLALICGLLLLTVSQAWSAGVPSTLEIKQAAVDGATLAYEEQGDGAPVVFVHGCCTDYRTWEAQRQATAPHYRFIALNLRYHGAAPWSDDGSKYSVQTHVDDVAAFIRGLNAGPVDLVGWSYSGPIRLLVALQHPELVHSLAIHEPGSVTFVTDPASLKSAVEDRQAFFAPVIAASKAGDLASVARLVPAGVNNQPDFFETAAPDIRSMFLDNARTLALFIAAPPPPPLTCDQLRQIKMPTMITRGEATRTMYRIASEGAASCIPGAKLVVIPGARHLAMVQQPDAFNAALLQFLSLVGSQPKAR